MARRDLRRMLCHELALRVGRFRKITDFGEILDELEGAGWEHADWAAAGAAVRAMIALKHHSCRACSGKAHGDSRCERYYNLKDAAQLCERAAELGLVSLAACASDGHVRGTDVVGIVAMIIIESDEPLSSSLDSNLAEWWDGAQHLV